ncbi:unnamed protein product, partial [Choristocarpus tenellus]
PERTTRLPEIEVLRFLSQQRQNLWVALGCDLWQHVARPCGVLELEADPCVDRDPSLVILLVKQTPFTLLFFSQVSDSTYSHRSLSSMSSDVISGRFQSVRCHFKSISIYRMSFKVDFNLFDVI